MMTTDCDSVMHVFFLMIRRPPRSTLDRSSAASDVYKRQIYDKSYISYIVSQNTCLNDDHDDIRINTRECINTVSYTHLRAHETVLDLVCRLLLEKKKPSPHHTIIIHEYPNTLLSNHT